MVIDTSFASSFFKYQFTSVAWTINKDSKTKRKLNGCKFLKLNHTPVAEVDLNGQQISIHLSKWKKKIRD